MEKIVYYVEIVMWLNKRETNQLDEKEQSAVVDCKNGHNISPPHHYTLAIKVFFVKFYPLQTGVQWSITKTWVGSQNLDQ